MPPGVRRAVTTQLGVERRLVLPGGSLSTVQAGGRLTVGFLRPPTADGPARLWMGFTNATDESRRFAFGPSPPFSHYWARPIRGHDESRSYLLVPDDDRRFPYGDVVPREPTDRRWVATGTLGVPTGPVERNWIELDPGDSIAGTYSLLVHPDASIRARGTHRFAGAPWTASDLVLSDYRVALRYPGVSRFAPDRSVPKMGPFGAQWYHELAGADRQPRTYLRPGSERIPIDGGSVELAVENYAPHTVTVWEWGLSKLHGGEWHRIAPWDLESYDGAGVSGEPPELVRPGERHEFRFDPTGATRPDTEAVVPGTRVGGLGRGLYAVHYGATAGGPGADVPAVIEDTGTPRTEGGVRTILAALLELTGEPAAVTPTDDVAGVLRDESTVTVEVEPKFTRSPPEGPELVVRRAEGVRGSRVLLAEQVNQFPALRNALAHFDDGVETVRVVTSGFRVRRPMAALGSPDEPLPFSFGNRPYEARLRDVVVEATTTPTTTENAGTASGGDPGDD